MTRIIRARIEETLEIIRDRLNKSGYGNAVGKRVVLTGGASQLAGLPEAARRILGRNVRIGRPLGVAGLPEAAKGPAFSTAVGLLIYPQVASFESSQGKGASRLRMTGTGGTLPAHESVVQGQFLEIGGDSPIGGRGGDAAGKAKDEDNDDQSAKAGHHRTQAPHHRVRRRRRRRQRRQQHDHRRACAASSSSSPTPTPRR